MRNWLIEFDMEKAVDTVFDSAVLHTDHSIAAAVTLPTLLAGASADNLALTAAAAMAAAVGIGACAVLTKSGMFGGVTA